MPVSPYEMWPVPDALELVLAQTQSLPAHQVALEQAVGLTLAASVTAPEPLPPFPASVKDGYAVVAADGPGEYTVLGEVTAGRVPNFTVTPGNVAYITTGAPLPPGADAVVMVEETTPLPATNGQPRVYIGKAVRSGDDIRAVGIDVTQGQQVLAAGTRLEAAEIGLLATVGAAQVSVYPRPTVAILSTGDELVEPSHRPGPGQIRDSNRAMIRAAVQAAGGIPLDLGIGRDNKDELMTLIRRGLTEADMLITSGGVSMGDLDLLKPILENEGQVHFGRILMKPGKPLTFATAHVAGRKRLVFALPGNPVSSLVTFYLFAVPALRKLAGWPNPYLQRVQAHLSQPLPLDAERPEYHRATLRWDPGVNNGCGGFWARSTGSQSSSRLLSMRSANALLELPQRAGVLEQGSMVTALIIGDMIGI
ncbi:MAG: molybdopterin molybdenumtransferase MoeA [Caldilineaceae bacterium]|nr:molybdopterin molybdenumtransferase MoeA [Caldilineaceae bacterium]MCB9155875.1 molybdopterin molybdenumtransferase MoeA [Caldilineaceae bacterium]